MAAFMSNPLFPSDQILTQTGYSKIIVINHLQILEKSFLKIHKFMKKFIKKKYECQYLGNKTLSIFPSAFVLSIHFPQMKIVVTQLAVFVISTHSRYQPGAWPVLSCSTFTLWRSPRSSVSKMKRSVRPLSNRFLNFCFIGRFPESPFTP